MGRIKITLVKRIAKDLLARYPDKFKSNFKENQKLVIGLIDAPSKKLRNSISGYLARLVKRMEAKKAS